MAPTTTAPIVRFSTLPLPAISKPVLLPFVVKNSYGESCSTDTSSNSFFSDSSHLHLFSNCAKSRAPITRVSTVPVEYASPAPEFDFENEIYRLQGLRDSLSRCRSLAEKMRTVDTDYKVESFSRLRGNYLAGLGLRDYDLYLVKCVIAAGQEHVFGEDFGRDFDDVEVRKGSAIKNALYALAEMIESWDANGTVGTGNFDLENKDALKALLNVLEEVEQFYDCIGGIIGYQMMVLKLLSQSKFEGNTSDKSLTCQVFEIHPPSVVDLAKDSEYASQAALFGIGGLPYLGEIYPLGGSADRLGLVHPETGECLPAALLPYGGRTLLEGLIRDLQAREFLYFKLFGKQCITPVAIMTSSAKNNHQHISSLCVRREWFGRGRSSFKLFEQPLVPTVTAKDGHWIISRPFKPVCKPGGHGVIWKLAHDKDVFKWFQSHARKGASVRQISNVVAATDLTLLALTGIGLRHQKKLGFASCQRNFGATEGINVLLEKCLDGKWSYGLTCIEYTEFDKFGISDQPLSSGSFQAEFPANTNILYVDLQSAELVGSSQTERSLPGMVLNVNKSITYTDQFGIKHSVPGGRLECTMQNIADNFSNTYPSRCYEGVEEGMDTFMVYNERKKVTSSAKKKRRHGDRCLHQTPDGSLLDIIRNAHDLLSQCGISIPKVEVNEKYANSGPPYLIFLHPALGPIWEVTRQKFWGGSITAGSELQVEVAEFVWRNVELNGSLIILGENGVGCVESNEIGEPIIQYGRRCARCRLENVKVMNNGIDWNSGDNIYWKHDVKRFERLQVILNGNAEFEATDVAIHGEHVFNVPDGHRMKVTSGVSGVDIEVKPIPNEWRDRGTWFWDYKIRGKSHIELQLVEQ